MKEAKTQEKLQAEKLFSKKIKELQEYRRDNIYNYSYKYYKVVPNGLELDEKLNKTYKDTREGYEQFKQDFKNYDIEYSGKISARFVKNRNDENEFCIFEEQLSDEPIYEKMEELYEEAFEAFCQLMDVKDKDAIKALVETRIHGMSVSIKDNYIHRTMALSDIIEDYEWDENFKMIFDKLKG